jgi:hypothetical protein
LLRPRRLPLIVLAAAIGLFALGRPAVAQADAPAATPAATTAAAPAGDHAMVFTGGQIDFSNFAFIGVTVALPGATIGKGFALRVSVDNGGYSYINDPLGTVKANFSGGELDAVYSITKSNVWTDLGAGVRYSYTGLTPYDPTNTLRGAQTEFVASADGGAQGGPWRVDWLGAYGTRLYDYQARIGLTHTLTPKWRVGGEVYAEGDPSYHLNQVGPIAAVEFTDRSELEFSGGWSWESGFPSRNYLRASFFQRF